MKLIKRYLNNIIEYLKDDNITLDSKSVYIISLVSIPCLACFVVVYILSGFDMNTIHFCFVCTVIFLCTKYLLYRFSDITFIKYCYVILLNFFIFPTLFYLSGDIYNEAALFFPIGIVITFFLIKERVVYVIAGIELIWYSFILILPCVEYESFSQYRDKKVPPLEMGLVFFIAAFIPMLIIVYQSSIFKRIHGQLKESGKIIEEAKYNKGRFLSNMTHEIRTPMNSIIGMNELILREELSSESRELAENIRISSNQLLKIINNILEFSKLDSNRMVLYPQKYDFNQLMTEVINAVASEYSNDDNDFYVDIDSNIPLLLFGDKVRIKQVFMYILFSAINKFPHNRISLKIKGDVDRATNSVLLSCTIAESGLGLSNNDINAMLSAYTQYDSRKKTDYQSIGLEFSICKEILEMMGGDLEIESIEDVGIAVRFNFINYIIDEVPLARLSLINEYSILVYCKEEAYKVSWGNVLSPFNLYPTFVSGPNAFRKAIENKRYTHIFIDDVFYEMLKDTIDVTNITDSVFVVCEAGSVYSDFGKCKIVRKPISCLNIIPALNNVWDETKYKLAQKKETVIYPQAKVLIVDDSLVNLKVLEGILSTFEICTSKCKSGPEALDILRNEEFDLLIYDQRMPEMDGVELLHLTKKLDNANALVPIICATADFGPEVSRYLISEGFVDYLAKPVRKHYLERMLRQYIPDVLAKNIITKEVADKSEDELKRVSDTAENKTNSDPTAIDFALGMTYVGDSKEAYCAVAMAYYKEGLGKIELIRKLANEDISLYTIEVHALKSSSASIGASGVSELFKSLEFAGRANNQEYIDAHTESTLVNFEKVLEKIKDYLIENDMYEEPEDESNDENVINLEPGQIQEIIDALASFNLKLCEEKLNDLRKINYGSQINKAIKEICTAYEHFDYHRVKDELNVLLETINCE